jgi:fatty-acyl-CoA synthase
MEKNAPLHARIAIALALFIPLYLAIAALGTKYGAWDWQTGLLALTFGGGLLLIGATALLALVSLVLILRKAPRTGGPLALIALVIPLVFVGLGLSAAGKGSANPIHDVATDTADPPQFSPETLTARQEAGANPLNDYSVPLGELDMWREADPALAAQSHADVIAERYPDLEPIAFSGSESEAIEAVRAAMAEMGLSDIDADPEAGRVEGVAETFWFGFEDDVVARIDDGRIDLRSVSRVGQSDLGANAERLRALRSAIEQRL